MAKGNRTGKGQFQKGNDPRRNTGGQRNAKAVAFNSTLRELIVEYGESNSTVLKDLTRVRAMVMKVWDEAELGEEWAVNWISDRVEGKVTQPISFSKMSDAELRDFIAQQLGSIGVRADRSE